MANELLIILVHFNLAAAAATLAVLAARQPIRHRFGAEVAYRLWLGVPLTGAAALFPPAQATRIVPPGMDPHFDPIWAGSQALAHAPAQPLLLLWLSGAAVAILVLTACQMRFLALARRGLAGPAVAGVVAPRVIMPADAEATFSAEERALIRAHERTHIDRGDPLINGAIALAQCLFWFNPMVHLAARTARLDQELACDAQVLAHRSGQRRRYAETLLKTQLGAIAAPLGCHWLAGEASHPLEQRIQALRQPRPDFRCQDHGAIALLCALAIAAYGAWRAQPSAPAVGVAPDDPPPVEAQHMQAIIVPPIRL